MKLIPTTLAIAACCLAAQAHATGGAKCEAGPKESWQPQSKLEQQLTARGWKVNRVKVDGGCYEVYGVDDKGKRVERYFHPGTLEPVQSSTAAKR